MRRWLVPGGISGKSQPRPRLFSLRDRPPHPPPDAAAKLPAFHFAPVQQPVCFSVTLFHARPAFEEGSVWRKQCSNEVGRWCRRYRSSHRQPNPPFILTTVCSKCAKLTMARYGGSGAERETRMTWSGKTKDLAPLEFALLLAPSMVVDPTVSAPTYCHNNLLDLLSP